MKLTRIERWILANQYRILELIDKKNADSHRNAAEALSGGYELYYEWLAEPIYDGDNVLSEDECRYVLEVMDMFDAMQHAYDTLPDKTGIEPRHLTFMGFDGNNETKRMAFARFFCEERGAYSHLRKGSDGFNSHMPTEDLYGRMMAAWKQSQNTHQLTKDDLIRITQAAIHPQHRGK